MAFVNGFSGGAAAVPRRGVARVCAQRVVMKVVDRLDSQPSAAFEQTKQVYTFSRYILGPHRAVVAPVAMDPSEKEVVLRAVYRQVFGNAYIMEEERAELRVMESQFLLGELSVKELVRALAKSSTYKVRFFEGAVQYRFIELCFKHLLGRAPDNHEEIAVHMRKYQQEGYDAEIDSYLDAGEYDNVFGDDTVPFLRFRGVYTPCDSFNRQCALQGGWANSDKAMGGAALSGYNGSDGRQMSTMIGNYISGKPIPYEKVAADTPLKSTAPNWYARPNPALAPQPAYVSAKEIAELRSRVSKLEAAWSVAVKQSAAAKDTVETWRAAAKEMAAMRGISPMGEAYFGGIAQKVDNGALAQLGNKASSYKKYLYAIETDEVSRLEVDLEEAKGQLRVLEAAMAKSTPMTRTAEFKTLTKNVAAVTAAEKADPLSKRPRISASRPKPTPAAAKMAAAEKKKGPFGLSVPSLPNLPNLPKLPSLSLPKVSLPFGKK
ncbi:Phycobilisome 32.1 kDa linker polypeptide, phycocyanin-associated, rod [Porphyridium purpureum]|uniref:Phycobilisome 32.1 kDa linker polypeptide, phycocyanin-associated, rod n=1 Tax=Porphyridium purpureum TaxID=35688 RepID=A0A5J4YX63_PORPP|nr:Chain b8, LRC2 [Porphyridium purpureum]6KGX_bA Chain bA, LRC2 [Porphyridium purpureum]7EZX_bB Chain bB, Phycobilisome 32.1 kDa linker polypeptide, phycocyanin-associated, rod [Porphyridium purpureum]7EZX_bM Chain bM, Phycobilisome 32.1 kDa linker polypeptide, phycocyanin-associated, rod [Porphyridium purpureum]7Y4L_b4 Chain b4, Phycobilisome 32.1 kDa linker polypeptide, phycocyanin-associated, rod [Porphyridium purpureum]7Y4L_bH Chain bH, Phycobilisome 32.1 kDa linker polypeptide, phycocyan|eukprot:POR5712..scf209_3